MEAVVPQFLSAPLRRRLGEFIERPVVQRGIIALILVNAAIQGMETSTAVMSSE